MLKEFNLSDKNFFGDALLMEDVKEFIRILFTYFTTKDSRAFIKYHAGEKLC